MESSEIYAVVENAFVTSVKVFGEAVHRFTCVNGHTSRNWSKKEKIHRSRSRDESKRSYGFGSFVNTNNGFFGHTE